MIASDPSGILPAGPVFDQVRQALAPLGDACVGVAVSGGGDSVALLHMAIAVAGQDRVAAVTVDHGLRPEAAQEAAQVAAFCASRGIAHATLHWGGWRGRGTGQGNLQAAAREARYALIADWAQAKGLVAVLLGHTRDDQAETFLMRLSREAGLDGLSGMARDFDRAGMRWLRPLLDIGRNDLRDCLRATGIGWSEDPSNDDLRFERVRARQALAALAPLGIGAAGLGRVMAQLSDARDALRSMVRDVAGRMIHDDRGDLVLNWTGLATQPGEVRRRCIVAALVWVGRATYPPRRENVAQLILALEHDGQRTLGGCVLRRKGHDLRISREAAALRGVAGPTDRVWDGRWQLDGPHAPALEIRVLGDVGLRYCPDWRDSGLPRASLAASPAVWAGDSLVAAPLAGLQSGWTARIVADFHTSLLSH